ncbi:MAG: orotate phosphoribosyltransferase [Devosia sp.]
MAAVVNLARPNSGSDTRQELFEIVRERSFRYGLFTLSSGKESHLYFNMKPTMMSPRGAELAARAFLSIAQEVGAEYVGGLEMGAVPVIGSMAAISSADKRPLKTVFVRKQAKAHGTRDVIEGLGPNETLENRSVLIVDDVATSGKSILKAIEEVRAVGGLVSHAACLVNRDEGGQELLAEHGVTLHSVLHARDFVDAR